MATQPAEPGAICIAELSADSPSEIRSQAKDLLLEYGRFVIAQPAAARFCYGSLESKAMRLPFSYHEQGGGCLVARVNDAPMGFVAWRALAPAPRVVADAWELKRLWVRPTARGLGLGRLLTQAVLDGAVAAGRKAVYLDTAPAAMGSAYKLYLDMDFVPSAPYNDNPVENLVYLVRML